MVMRIPAVKHPLEVPAKNRIPFRNKAGRKNCSVDEAGWGQTSSFEVSRWASSYTDLSRGDKMIIDAFSSPRRKKFSSSGVSAAQIIALVLVVQGLYVRISVEGRR